MVKIPAPKRGWAHATDDESLQALCEVLAHHCCLQYEAVLTWARKHTSYRKLLRQTPQLIAPKNIGKMEFLIAVLNDQPLATGT